VVLPDPEPPVDPDPAVVVGFGAPGGGVVGSVDGCWAVFQVAVFGHAVAATVGEARP
jgi:hypothetical protein